METITKVREGQKIKVGRGEVRTVKPACDVKDNGRWFCVTHQEGPFRHNFEKDSHIHTGEHELVWICLIHGPEVP